MPAGAALQDRLIIDLADLLRPGDLLVFNDTKVIPARLVGKRGEAKTAIASAEAESKPGNRRVLARCASSW